LELGDVPTEVAETEGAASERRAAVTAEPGASPGVRDSVHDEAAAALKRAHRFVGLRAEEPVDRPEVQPTRTKPDLERADCRIALTSSRAGENEYCGKDEPDRDRRYEPSRSHAAERRIPPPARHS
jgi:hypothetical protein